MEHLVVIGGGGHARVVISILKKLKQYHLLGYTDNIPGTDILGIPYLGDDRLLPDLAQEYAPCFAALGIGNTSISSSRLELLEYLKEHGFKIPTLISPTAVINEDVEIGDGTVICDHVVIETGTRIGNACILNTASTIDHDCIIKDGTHIAPGAILCGHVEIGSLSMIGAGSVIIQTKKICDNCLIGAGSIVTKDLLEPTTYCGSPAKPILNLKENI